MLEFSLENDDLLSMMSLLASQKSKKHSQMRTSSSVMSRIYSHHFGLSSLISSHLATTNEFLRIKLKNYFQILLSCELGVMRRISIRVANSDIVIVKVHRVGILFYVTILCLCTMPLSGS